MRSDVLSRKIRLAFLLLLSTSLIFLVSACNRDNNPDVETAFIIFPSPNEEHSFIIRIETDKTKQTVGYSTAFEDKAERASVEFTHYSGSVLYGLWSPDSRLIAIPMHPFNLGNIFHAEWSSENNRPVATNQPVNINMMLLDIRYAQRQFLARTTVIEQSISMLSLEHTFAHTILPLCWSDDGRLILYALFQDVMIGGQVSEGPHIECFIVLHPESDTVLSAKINEGINRIELNHPTDPLALTGFYDFNTMLRKIEALE
jgi:hypothetical protein